MTDQLSTPVDGRPCRDCAISPGQPHGDGCDVARCLVTGGQRIGCNENHDHGQNVWTGMWPGEAECREFGWFSVFTDNGWQRCGADTPGAIADVDRLNRSPEAEWDPVAQRWQKTGLFGLLG